MKVAKTVENLELALNSTLPDTYRDFIRNIGAYERNALIGSDFEIYDLLENNEGLVELFQDNNLDFELPEKYLCFLMHQGYIAFWFELDSNENDPVVWNYSEGTTKKPRKLEKFSMFIPSIIKDWGGA